MNKEETTIIIIKQNAKKAVEIADKTYVLEGGKIALHGRKEILNPLEIKSIYFSGK